MSHTFNAVLLESATQLEAGEFQAAFTTISQVINYPAKSLGEDVKWRQAWALFKEIAVKIAGVEFAEKITPIIQNPDDVQALYQLGYELVEENLNEIGATLLNRADALYPNHEGILSELSTALERSGLYHFAFLHLQASHKLQETSYLCRYLLAFNGIMSGMVTEARAAFDKMAEPSDENEEFWKARIGSFLERIDRAQGVCALDEKDLRGWHFALTAGNLLHLSPHGFEEGMGGRYAYFQDNESLCQEAITRVKTVLDAWEAKPPCVFYASDRNSEILARALATELGINLQAWPEGGTTEAGIIVVYDLSKHDGAFLQSVREHAAGQLLWAHAQKWDEDFPIAADLVTFLYQFNVSPWEGGAIKIDPDTQEITQKEVDAESPEIIAARLLKAGPPEDSFDDYVQLSRVAKMAGVPPASGLREKYFMGSPVQSNRFK